MADVGGEEDGSKCPDARCRDHMHAQLPSLWCEEAIASMVKNNLPLYRSYDAVALDVPAEAFVD